MTWSCPALAARIRRRLVARYGNDIVIIHGNEPWVDASFAAAAKELGVTVKARVIDRKNTGFPTIGQRNRELLLTTTFRHCGSDTSWHSIVSPRRRDQPTAKTLRHRFAGS